MPAGPSATQGEQLFKLSALGALPRDGWIEQFDVVLQNRLSARFPKPQQSHRAPDLNRRRQQEWAANPVLKEPSWCRRCNQRGHHGFRKLAQRVHITDGPGRAAAKTQPDTKTKTDEVLRKQIQRLNECPDVALRSRGRRLRREASEDAVTNRRHRQQAASGASAKAPGHEPRERLKQGVRCLTSAHISGGGIFSTKRRQFPNGSEADEQLSVSTSAAPTCAAASKQP